MYLKYRIILQTVSVMAITAPSRRWGRGLSNTLNKRINLSTLNNISEEHTKSEFSHYKPSRLYPKNHMEFKYNQNSVQVSLKVKKFMANLALFSGEIAWNFTKQRLKRKFDSWTENISTNLST